MKRTLSLMVEASEHVTEAIDPQKFGDLRSLLAAPYKGLDGSKKTFLMKVAHRVSELVREYKRDEGAIEMITTYAHDILSRITNEDMMALLPAEAHALYNKQIAYEQGLEPVAVKLLRDHQLAIVTMGSAKTGQWMSLNISPEEWELKGLLNLKIGKAKQLGPDGAFYLQTEVEKLVENSAKVADMLNLIARSHRDLRLDVYNATHFESVTFMLKQIVNIAPTTANLTARIFIRGWMTPMSRSADDENAVTLLLRQMERERFVFNTQGGLKVEWAFVGGVHRVDDEEREALDRAQRSGLIRGWELGNTQGSVIFELN
jgi:hypothetical protein